MKIQKVTHPKYIQAVSQSLQNSEFTQALTYLKQTLLSNKKWYIIGGAVRDPLVTHIHNTKTHTRDLDIIIDESENPKPVNLKEMFASESHVSTTSFGSIRWNPHPNVEIDITTTDNANVKSSNGRGTLNTWLRSCDFTTSSLAYNPFSQTIYEFKALKGITQ